MITEIQEDKVISFKNNNGRTYRFSVNTPRISRALKDLGFTFEDLILKSLFYSEILIILKLTPRWSPTRITILSKNYAINNMKNALIVIFVIRNHEKSDREKKIAYK